MYDSNKYLKVVYFLTDYKYAVFYLVYENEINHHINIHVQICTMKETKPEIDTIIHNINYYMLRLAQKYNKNYSSWLKWVVTNVTNSDCSSF